MIDLVYCRQRFEAINTGALNELNGNSALIYILHRVYIVYIHIPQGLNECLCVCVGGDVGAPHAVNRVMCDCGILYLAYLLVTNNYFLLRFFKRLTYCTGV